MKVVTIGRGLDNDVQINDNLVSRNHLQIVQDDFGNFRLVDFGSKNGCYVNGKRVYGEVEISPNDIIRIGNTTLPWKNFFSNRGSGNRNPSIIKSVKFGREFGNIPALANDHSASRVHCEIVQYSDGTCRIVDLGSKNGTFVNGKIITGETVLASTDVVRIGNTLLKWQSHFPGMASPTVAPESVEANPTNDYGAPPPQVAQGDSDSVGIVVLLLGLAAIGILAYMVIVYFTSSANDVLRYFGGSKGSMAGFLVYLRGYSPWLKGQWALMITALVLGAVGDLIAGVTKEKKGSLFTVGSALSGLAVFVAIVFILLASFAPQILEQFI